MLYRGNVKMKNMKGEVFDKVYINIFKKLTHAKGTWVRWIGRKIHLDRGSIIRQVSKEIERW